MKDIDFDAAILQADYLLKIPVTRSIREHYQWKWNSEQWIR